MRYSAAVLDLDAYRTAGHELRDTGFETREFTTVMPARHERPIEYNSCGSSLHPHPRIVVRCVAQHEGQVLLCQRADEPRLGLWNTPGGFLERGETLQNAARRETLEESGVTLGSLQLAWIYEFPQMSEIVAIFLGSISTLSITPGPESFDARLFDIGSIPWNRLAFPTDSEALRRTFEETQGQPIIPRIIECFWDADGRIFAR